ncbi:hypothetical protein FNV43_RR27037 [Rhamnella rubrinervis]|uniref:Uncharacterized protein n=1 Tax=Rhamnella rubrinervis TaxID=2594499 RepID=A0A8K0GK81_9ROSA|nr:hypothetical protein FNV43_RR27037 [Rhamnella rubrinervis]
MICLRCEYEWNEGEGEEEDLSEAINLGEADNVEEDVNLEEDVQVNSSDNDWLGYGSSKDDDVKENDYDEELPMAKVANLTKGMELK